MLQPSQLTPVFLSVMSGALATRTQENPIFLKKNFHKIGHERENKNAELTQMKHLIATTMTHLVATTMKHLVASLLCGLIFACSCAAQEYLTLFSSGASALSYDTEDQSPWSGTRPSTYFDDSASQGFATNTNLYESVSIPFSFPFFGSTVSNFIYIDPNGALHTTPTPSCCQQYGAGLWWCSFGGIGFCDFNSVAPTSKNYFDMIVASSTDYYNWPGINYTSTVLHGEGATLPRISSSVSSSRATVFYDSVHLFTMYRDTRVPFCPEVASVRHSFKMSVFASGRITFRYLNISDPRQFGCWVDVNPAARDRVWMAGLRPSVAAQANYLKPPPASFGWDTTLGGKYFPRSITQSGLVVTYCALGASICVSPSVALLGDGLSSSGNGGGGGTLLTVFMPNSADCLDLVGATLANATGGAATVIGLGARPGASVGPPIELYCRFASATAAVVSSALTVGVNMTADGAAFIDSPVTAIDITGQRVVRIWNFSML